MALHDVSFIRILALYVLCCFRSRNLAGFVLILDVMCYIFQVVPIYIYMLSLSAYKSWLICSSLIKFEPLEYYPIRSSIPNKLSFLILSKTLENVPVHIVDFFPEGMTGFSN